MIKLIIPALFLLYGFAIIKLKGRTLITFLIVQTLGLLMGLALWGFGYISFRNILIWMLGFSSFGLIWIGINLYQSNDIQPK